ncbi:MAG: BatA domain-containing protein, partial [Victivallales bacterium]|nr:BatA domain-containing protein [Victivallales bacterium]
MFWLLLSLAGPIILHLLNRQRLRTVVFPSIRFLRHSQIPQDGRRRLRDILRLLLRLAFLTAVIILLAGPKWTPPAEAKSETDSKTAVFLLDASASMATASRLENGRRLVDASLKEHA